MVEKNRDNTSEEESCILEELGKPTGGISESTELKMKMFTKKIVEVEVPEHIRKATIIINDKKPDNPISVIFAGDWAGSDLNLAGKHLILEYNLFVRNRAIKDK